jgi:predicted nucleotidyltransferase
MTLLVACEEQNLHDSNHLFLKIRKPLPLISFPCSIFDDDLYTLLGNATRKQPFDLLLAEITPTSEEYDEALALYSLVREEVKKFPFVKDCILVGSTMKKTAVKPLNDVDIWIVTSEDFLNNEGIHTGNSELDQIIEKKSKERGWTKFMEKLFVPVVLLYHALVHQHSLKIELRTQNNSFGFTFEHTPICMDILVARELNELSNQDDLKRRNKEPFLPIDGSKIEFSCLFTFSASALPNS